MAYSEQHFLRLLFLLADTQEWINDLGDELMNTIPRATSRCRNKSYYLGISALAHILERHYHRIERHPGTGKFTVTLPEIIELIKEAKQAEVVLIPATGNFARTLQLKYMIGHDRNGNCSSHITVITDSAGNIITAFPGLP